MTLFDKVDFDKIPGPVIWRLQEPTPGVPRDYSSCLGYGTMVTVLANDARPSSFPQKCIETFHSAFLEFKDTDYLLWSGGDPITPLLAGIALEKIGVRYVKWLRWDRRTNGDGSRSDKGYYVPVMFDLEDNTPSLQEEKQND